MEGCCRVCLISENVILHNLSECRLDETIAEIFYFVSGIEIDFQDEFPQHICSPCTDQILSAAVIKKKALSTDQLLRTKIKEEFIKAEQSFHDDPISDLQQIAELSLFNFDDREQYANLEYDVLDRNVDTLKEEVTHRRPKKRSILSSPSIINKSERKNKVPNEMDYKCFICEMVFDKISTKNKHVKTEHGDDRICKLCQMKCKTAISLETHIKFHFRDYGFMCEICSKTFRYANRLNSHMALHHAKAAEMICDLCGLSTKFKNNIKRHMKSVHMKLREFQCTECSGHEYSTQEALNSHLYRYHNVPAPIKCPDCHHGFTFDSELRAHKKHGFCSNNANTPFLRRGKTHYEHLEISELTGEHICKLCNESFPSKNKWSMHNYLKHKYSNKCDECNIVFTNYTSLIRHEKVKHQGHKPFKCEFCLKCFGQKVSLISHRNTHTGEKTFMCAFCPFRSGDHGTVSKHKKKMHPQMIISSPRTLGSDQMIK